MLITIYVNYLLNFCKLYCYNEVQIVPLLTDSAKAIHVNLVVMLTFFMSLRILLSIIRKLFLRKCLTLMILYEHRISVFECENNGSVHFKI